MDKKLEARIARLEKMIKNEDNDRGANAYAEANQLFYKALAKYRAALNEIISDGSLDQKSFVRLRSMIEKFSDAGNKLVNSGEKWFDWSNWNKQR